MSKYISREEGLRRLNGIIERSLTYSHKFKNLNLYAFGFGDYIRVVTPEGTQKDVCSATLHIACRFKIIEKGPGHRVDTYYEESPAEVYNLDVKKLIGLKIRRVDISEKNDLWLDLGSYWLVFATFENDEESWRFFSPYSCNPHLVASGFALRLDY